MEDSSQRSIKIKSTSTNINRNNSLVSSAILVKLSLGLGILLTTLDLTAVLLSIYSIQSFFKVDPSTVQWIIISYLLVVIVFVNVSKNLTSRYSHKQIFQSGLIFFIFGSFVSVSASFFPNFFLLLILGRIVQGLGASGILASSGPLVSKYGPTENKDVVRSWNNVLFSTGLIIGPLIGGLLTTFINWQSVFITDSLVALVSLGLVSYTIPDSKSKRTGNIKNLDYYNIGLFISALAFILYGLSAIEKLNVTKSLTAIAFVMVGLYLFITFYSNQKKSKNPIINFNKIHYSSIALGLIINIIVFSLFFIILFQLPILIQETYELPAIVAGLVIITTTISWVLVRFYAEKSNFIFYSKYILPVSFIALLLNFIAFIITTTGWFYWFLTVPFTILFGIITGLITVINENNVKKSIPTDIQDAAREILTASTFFGIALGIIISTLFLANFLPYYADFYHRNINDWSVYIPSYQSTLLIGAATAFAGIIISFKGQQMVNKT